MASADEESLEFRPAETGGQQFPLMLFEPETDMTSPPVPVTAGETFWAEVRIAAHARDTDYPSVEDLVFFTAEVAYDPGLLEVVEVEPGASTQGWELATTQLEGRVAVNLQAPAETSFTGYGQLLRVKFRALEGSGGTAVFSLQGATMAEDAFWGFLIDAADEQIGVYSMLPRFLGMSGTKQIIPLSPRITGASSEQGVIWLSVDEPSMGQIWNARIDVELSVNEGSWMPVSEPAVACGEAQFLVQLGPEHVFGASDEVRLRVHATRYNPDTESSEEVLAAFETPVYVVPLISGAPLPDISSYVGVEFTGVSLQYQSGLNHASPEHPPLLDTEAHSTNPIVWIVLLHNERFEMVDLLAAGPLNMPLEIGIQPDLPEGEYQVTVVAVDMFDWTYMSARARNVPLTVGTADIGTHPVLVFVPEQHPWGVPSEHVFAGDTFWAEVRIDPFDVMSETPNPPVENLAAFEAAIIYDPEVLEVVSCAAGSAVPDWHLEQQPQPGRLEVRLQAPAGTSFAGHGQLIKVEFSPLDSAGGPGIFALTGGTAIYNPEPEAHPEFSWSGYLEDEAGEPIYAVTYAPEFLGISGSRQIIPGQSMITVANHYQQTVRLSVDDSTSQKLDYAEHIDVEIKIDDADWSQLDGMAMRTGRHDYLIYLGPAQDIVPGQHIAVRFQADYFDTELGDMNTLGPVETPVFVVPEVLGAPLDLGGHTGVEIQHAWVTYQRPDDTASHEHPPVVDATIATPNPVEPVFYFTSPDGHLVGLDGRWLRFPAQPDIHPTWSSGTYSLLIIAFDAFDPTRSVTDRVTLPLDITGEEPRENIPLLLFGPEGHLWGGGAPSVYAGEEFWAELSLEPVHQGTMESHPGVQDLVKFEGDVCFDADVLEIVEIQTGQAIADWNLTSVPGEAKLSVTLEAPQDAAFDGHGQLLRVKFRALEQAAGSGIFAILGGTRIDEPHMGVEWRGLLEDGSAQDIPVTTNAPHGYISDLREIIPSEPRISVANHYKQTLRLSVDDALSSVLHSAELRIELSLNEEPWFEIGAQAGGFATDIGPYDHLVHLPPTHQITAGDSVRLRIHALTYDHEQQQHVVVYGPHVTPEFMVPQVLGLPLDLGGIVGVSITDAWLEYSEEETSASHVRPAFIHADISREGPMMGPVTWAIVVREPGGEVFDRLSFGPWASPPFEVYADPKMPTGVYEATLIVFDMFDPTRTAIASRSMPLGVRQEVTRAEISALLAKTFDVVPYLPVEPTYTDVPLDYWAAGDIYALTQAEIASGYPDGSFAPEDTVSRAGFAVLVFRMLDLESYFPEEPSFLDVGTEHFAFGAIERLRKERIVGGFEDGTFGPDLPLLHSEAYQVLSGVRSADRAGVARMVADRIGLGPYYPNEPLFLDVPLDHWAAGHIYAMQEAGLMEGYPDGTFRPEEEVLRAQFALLLSRSLELEPYVPTVSSYTDVPLDHWASGCVERLTQLGMMRGYDDGSFRPDEPIMTRDVWHALSIEIDQDVPHELNSNSPTVVGQSILFSLTNHTDVVIWLDADGHTLSVGDCPTPRPLESDQLHNLMLPAGDTIQLLTLVPAPVGCLGNLFNEDVHRIDLRLLAGGEPLVTNSVFHWVSRLVSASASEVVSAQDNADGTATISVRARDADGAPIPGLTAHDFSLIEPDWDPNTGPPVALGTIEDVSETAPGNYTLIWRHAPGTHTLGMMVATAVIQCDVSIGVGASISGQVALQGRGALARAGISVKLVGHDISTVTADDGTFVLHGVPEGADHRLLIRFPLYLAHIIEEVAVASGENVSCDPVTLRAGDASGNNRVGLIDLAILAQTYGLTHLDPGFDQRADFSGSNSVGLLDLALLASNYGTSGAGIPPGE